MMLKSISSFIASVLLIGFTIASGIIVYYFLTTLPKVQTKEVSSQASKVLSCAGAVYDVKVRNCNLLNGLVLWLRMDEGSGNITYDYSGYNNNGTYYSSGIQENSTLLQLNSTVSGVHYFYINDVPNERIARGSITFGFSAPSSTYVRIYVNGVYKTEATVSGSGFRTFPFGTIDNLIPNAWNSVTYVVNNVINITYSKLNYNFVSSDAKYCYNNNCYSSWSSGKFGNALLFDGNSNWVNTSARTIKEVTLVAWVKPRGLYVNSFLPIITPSATNSPRLLIYGDSRDVSNCISERTYSVVLTDPNAWYHLVCTNSGDRSKLYVNGTKLLDQSQNAVASGYYNIGGQDQGYFSGNNAFFNGTIDEVRIYNRALSDIEVKQLYYNGLTNKFNITVGLLNYGYADLGKSFTAIVYLKNGTILQLPLILNRDLTKGSYLENNLTIDSYYPSYGLIDKIMVCSNDCQGVCYEVNVNNQC